VRVKSLKTLLDQADQFCKSPALSKTASAQETEVSALANLLVGAETSVTINYDPEAAKQTEIDKIAESLNRVQTASEIDVVLQLADFEKKAGAEGFSRDQIKEALSKIAAVKIAKNIPLLVAMGFVPVSGPGEDKNALPKKPIKETKDKSQAQMLGSLNLSKSMGY
jgi:hypothetical protein